MFTGFRSNSMTDLVNSDDNVGTSPGKKSLEIKESNGIYHHIKFTNLEDENDGNQESASSNFRNGSKGSFGRVISSNEEDLPFEEAKYGGDEECENENEFMEDPDDGKAFLMLV